MLGLGWSGLIKGLAALLCIVGVVSLALIYFIPTPPSKISIATAFKGGAYELFGYRYREILAGSHVNLDVRLSKGSVENLRLLQDKKSDVQVAFVQGGISNGKQEPGVLSLGRINYYRAGVDCALAWRLCRRSRARVQLRARRLAD